MLIMHIEDVWVTKTGGLGGARVEERFLEIGLVCVSRAPSLWKAIWTGKVSRMAASAQVGTRKAKVHFGSCEISG